MKITFLGHAALKIQTEKHTLVVDPFISGNDLAKDRIDLSSLKPDYILLTHAHQDHILDVERLAGKGVTIISNYEIVSHFEKKGLEGHPMNHGGERDFGFGWLKYVNAVHTSSFPDGSYGGQPGGFLLRSSSKQIYIAGDTALHMDMKLIPEYGEPDLAILPIGDNFTMGVADAIRACDFIRCDRVLGVHYDTFGYIVIDKDQAVADFKAAGKTLLLPEIGSSIDV
ncbi:MULTISPECIES: metal-dependent hydrolase [unclassified Robiginitalea]|uniref:metal-dependent hydrolase n=1 Tax=Robiginitalea TaxID=252306 RepID=UPI002349EAF2|nr:MULTISPECIES: metal-dependent hydrolase [unclassified Robiginitalea]MDC6354211.1 metal-dependent hydrolase [Robiginitalea sp. PM2]MDC6374478.1 metal-dependent hydrolase [Robiginitalea sp. SP8]